jgi:hypothetical protein
MRQPLKVPAKWSADLNRPVVELRKPGRRTTRIHEDPGGFEVPSRHSPSRRIILPGERPDYPMV